jgi:hypothetical protein
LKFQRAMANVTDDADDFVRLVVHYGDQSFAEWLFVRKDRIDQLLTDDDHVVALPHFLFAEVSAAQQRDTQ